MLSSQVCESHTAAPFLIARMLDDAKANPQNQNMQVDVRETLRRLTPWNHSAFLRRWQGGIRMESGLDHALMVFRMEATPLHPSSLPYC